MHTGTIKWFNSQKGFGFIQREDGNDVFVHYSCIEMDGFKTLCPGEQVQYELQESEKGLSASKVQKI